MDAAREPPCVLGQLEVQIELRALAAEPPERLRFQPIELELSGRRVLQHQRCLKQRIARQVAPGGERLDELLEGQVLVGIGLQRPGAHPRQVLLEAGRAREVRAQHQRVDEEPDQALELRTAAPRDGHPHGQVLLAAVAIQQHLEGRQQRHEQRRALAPAQRLEPAGERLAELEAHPGAAVARRHRPRPVRGQLEHRQLGERLPPVGELLLEHVPLQPLPLPQRVVGVLHRQLGQRRSLALAVGAVQRRELLEQHSHRPAVGDDVVQVEQQPVLARRQSQQPRSDERPALQVERSLRLLLCAALRLGFALRRRERTEILRLQRQAQLRLDHLYRLAVVHLEARAQRLVPAQRAHRTPASAPRHPAPQPNAPPAARCTPTRSATTDPATTAAAGQRKAVNAGRNRRAQRLARVKSRHALPNSGRNSLANA